MTPHRHWIRNYKPCHIEVKLADGSSIYSEGVGTVLFWPVVNGNLVEIHDGGERQVKIDGITTTIYYRKFPTVR